MSSVAPHKMIIFYLKLFVTANAGRNRLTAVWPFRKMFKARKVIQTESWATFMLKNYEAVFNTRSWQMCIQKIRAVVIVMQLQLSSNNKTVFNIRSWQMYIQKIRPVVIVRQLQLSRPLFSPQRRFLLLLTISLRTPFVKE